MAHRFVTPVATGLGLSLVACFAQAAPPTPKHPCATIADDSARLACYDEAFGRPAGAGSANPAAPAAAAPAAAVAVDPAAKAREDFGLSEAAKQAREPSQDRPVVPTSVTGKVVQLTRSALTGEATVTLDNGQVWTEVEAYSGIVLRKGDVVTIRKASLGSFLLVTPRNVATRVRRLK
jgi:hypothetical protein